MNDQAFGDIIFSLVNTRKFRPSPLANEVTEVTYNIYAMPSTQSHHILGMFIFREYTEQDSSTGTTMICNSTQAMRWVDNVQFYHSDASTDLRGAMLSVMVKMKETKLIPEGINW